MSWMQKLLERAGLRPASHPLISGLEELDYTAQRRRLEELDALDDATLAGFVPTLGARAHRIGPASWFIGEILQRICQRRVPLTEAGIAGLIAATDVLEFDAVVVGAIERHVEREGLGSLESGIRAYRDEIEAIGMKGKVPLVARLDTVLGVLPTAYSSDGPFGERLAATERASDPESWAPIEALLLHAGQIKSKPSQRWLKQGRTLVEQVDFAALLTTWFDGIDLRQTTAHGWSVTAGFDVKNETTARGLIALVEVAHDAGLEGLLGRLAEACYRKVKNVGAPSKSVGNQCVRTLGALGTTEAVGQLTRLRSALKYRQARDLVDRTLTELGTAQGLSPAELEEMSVPRFGLDADGIRRTAVGDSTAELAVVGSAVELVFVSATGKRLKSVPKAVREGHPDVLKQLKADKKDLQRVLEGQSARIERFWLLDRSVSLDVLRERYLEHPVVAGVARRLLWAVDGQLAFWRDGDLRTLDGSPAAGERARLWHPLDDQGDEVLVWRDLLDELGVQQPFEQLWRGVYRGIEPARFTGRILHQMAVVEHSRREGWIYALQGYWDSANDPELTVPERGATITVELQPLPHADDDFKMQYVQVGRTRIDAPDADPVLISELMRTVDQLVTRCTLRVAPNGAGFTDGIDRTAALYGPLTATGERRAAVLRRILPRLPMAQACRVQEPFLLVDGPEGWVELHLGTLAARRDGNPVGFLPSKQHSAMAKRVLLPTENDPGLVELLRMAFQLAG